MKNILFWAGVALTSSYSSAYAQSESLFDRDRNISVLQREREGYQPLGIRSGQFLIRPRLDLTVAYTDNVFAINDGELIAQQQPGESDADFALRNEALNDAFQERDDLYFILRPSVNIESQWARHEIIAGAYTEIYQHLDFDNENIVNAGIFADGRLDVRRNTFLTGGFSYDLLNEDRRSANSVVIPLEPIEYRVGQAYVGAQHEIGRIKFRGRLTGRDYDYDDALIFVNTIGNTDQSFRNRLETSVLVQADYAITRDSSVFLRGTLNERDYDVNPGIQTIGVQSFDLNRNSSGYGIAAGVDFDISSLVRGSVAIGFNEQDYDSNDFGTISGLSLDAGVEWFPTELTTITFNASRGIRDAAILNSIAANESAAGLEATEFGVKIDHEMRRNILLHGTASYNQFEFEGIDRTDNVLRASLGGTYFINRYLSANLTFAHTNRESDADDALAFVREYEANEAFLTLTAQR